MMLIKKITGTRSYMIVEFEKRSVKIDGELTTQPAFYGYLNSIKNWEPPFEKELITEEQKSEIIEAISNYNNVKFHIYLENW